MSKVKRSYPLWQSRRYPQCYVEVLYVDKKRKVALVKAKLWRRGLAISLLWLYKYYIKVPKIKEELIK